MARERNWFERMKGRRGELENAASASGKIGGLRPLAAQVAELITATSQRGDAGFMRGKTLFAQNFLANLEAGTTTPQADFGLAKQRGWTPELLVAHLRKIAPHFSLANIVLHASPDARYHLKTTNYRPTASSGWAARIKHAAYLNLACPFSAQALHQGAVYYAHTQNTAATEDIRMKAEDKLAVHGWAAKTLGAEEVGNYLPLAKETHAYMAKGLQFYLQTTGAKKKEIMRDKVRMGDFRSSRQAEKFSAGYDEKGRQMWLEMLASWQAVMEGHATTTGLPPATARGYRALALGYQTMISSSAEKLGGKQRYAALLNDFRREYRKAVK